MNKEKKFLKERLDSVDAALKAARPGTDEYKKLLSTRKKIVEQLDHEKVKIPAMEIGTGFVLPAISILASVGTTIWLGNKYESVAKMAYGLDDEFKMCNGRTWNIKDKIVSLLPKKF